MNISVQSPDTSTTLPLRRSGSSWFRRLVLDRLRRLEGGRIVLREGDLRLPLGNPGADGLECELTVHDPRFYRRVVTGGSIGAAEAYMDGLWSADDLTTLIRIMARDRGTAEGLEGRLASFGRLLDRIRHLLRANTRIGSRKNISEHYDLGNDFFATFLDPTMSYSCAVFDDPRRSLEQASIAKNDLICRKLRLGAEDEVVEIGTGWGGFAIHAARNYGCRVVTTTISRQQHEYAAREVEAHGLSDRITLLLEDYRDLPGRLDRRFDKLVSIEMIEAVGHENLETYFRVCSDLVKPEGWMLIQAIVIADRLYESYRKSVDFIQRYIFPGGLTPSVSALATAMSRAGELRIADLDDLTPHYATTLKLWRRNFRANREVVEAMGFSERFRRMWEFYFSYCEGGFREHTIGDVQLLLAGPRARTT